MYPTTRHQCHACREILELAGPPGRRDECPRCGAELHVCLNCAFFDASLARGCRENQAEEVRERSRANFCAWFRFRTDIATDDPAAAERKAKNAFDALFSKK